ncbi:hypothetical protein PLICRDRAFT_525344 [Plicaturopsis crispa FD-325 SS-3]|nr:hypothetical protein PLICRDRAFT_525344 [Plicaturopsis crispa FD-325 SS-3]
MAYGFRQRRRYRCKRSAQRLEAFSPPHGARRRAAAYCRVSAAYTQSSRITVTLHPPKAPLFIYHRTDLVLPQSHCSLPADCTTLLGNMLLMCFCWTRIAHRGPMLSGLSKCGRHYSMRVVDTRPADVCLRPGILLALSIPYMVRYISMNTLSDILSVYSMLDSSSRSPNDDCRGPLIARIVDSTVATHATQHRILPLAFGCICVG